MASGRSKANSVAATSVDASRHPGYVNLGNTCFLNSTLQAISATQSLRELYLPSEELSKIGSTNGGALSPASTPGPSSRRASVVSDLIDARCKSPVLRLADEEHGRQFGRSISRPPSASIESSIAALASQAVCNPTPADIHSIQKSDAQYHLTRADLPLNTAFRQVLEKSWDTKRTGRIEASSGAGKKGAAAARSNSINPKSLLNEMSSKYDQYGEYRQQDGHELLRHLLDSLRMEEMDVIKKIQPPQPKVRRRSRRIQLQPVHKTSSINGESAQLKPLVDNLFCGKLLSCVICEGCRHVSHTYEDFYDISLSLRPESEAKETSKRQRIRSFADRWRQRSANGKVVDNMDTSKPLQESLAMLRDGSFGSLSDTEQSDEPMLRSHSRLGRGIGRPRSVADPAKVDANSKEGSKTFIKRQMQQSDVETAEKAMDNLTIEDRRREPTFVSGGAASLLRAVSGRKTPISRTASPMRRDTDESDAEKSRKSQHSEHHSISLHHRKKRTSRHAQYLQRMLAEATPMPQQNNLGALLWGRKTGASVVAPDASPDHGHRRHGDDLIAQQASTGLVRALHHFTSVEVLDGANSFSCKRCWRIANPPSTDEHEKLRLRRLRRGKNADDSEMSSDDESSSDEESKERKQREMLQTDGIVPPATLMSSASSFATLSDDPATSMSRSASLQSSSQAAPASANGSNDGMYSDAPSVLVSTSGPHDDQTQTPTTATTRIPDVPASAAITISTPGNGPQLRAPKPIVASLKGLQLNQNPNESSDESSSDEKSEDGVGASEDTNAVNARRRAIRYADEDVSTITKPSTSMHAPTVKRKRSMHSIQRRALKRFLIAEPPKVLVFHFKRFQATGRGFSFATSFRKIDDAITFPEHLEIKPWLAPPREEYDRHGKLKQSSDPRALQAQQAEVSAENEAKGRELGHSHAHDRHLWGWKPHNQTHGMAVSSETDNAPKTKYRLYAVVVHQGTMSGGHYTAYVLSDRADDTLKAMASNESRKNSPISPAKDARGDATALANSAASSPANNSASAASRVDPLSSVSSLGSDFGDAANRSTEVVAKDVSESLTPVPSKKSDERQWIFASDAQVRAATTDEVLKAQAYMLFYEQM